MSLDKLFNILSKSCSVTVSIFAVASSKIRTSGFLSIALINAINCFCHKLIDSHDVETLVSNHFSNFESKFNNHIFFKTSSICSFVKLKYSSFQYKILSLTFHVNKNGSCKINQILSVRSL